MFPASFDYVAAASFDEAVDLAVRYGPEAKFLSGGCSLIPLMKLRLVEPGVVVDLNRVTGADQIVETPSEIRIGALVREAQVEASTLIARRLPILADTSRVIADPLVRNRGTVCGNLAHADPANDHPAAMLALEASVVAQGPNGRRTIPAVDLFEGFFATTLGVDEVIVEVRVPLSGPRAGSAYVKIERQVGDFPVVAAAATVTLADDGRIAAARIALTNTGPTPIRASATEAGLVGAEPRAVAIREAAEAAREGLAPWDEHRGRAAYKLALVPVAVRRALERAVERAVAV